MAAKIPMKLLISSVILFFWISIETSSAQIPFAPDSDASAAPVSRKPLDKSMAIPASKLVHFERHERRVPNQYIVMLRDDSELALAHLQAKESYKVSPEISASTPDGTTALSLAFANHYGLKLRWIYKTEKGLRGFAFYSASETALQDLAGDLRVKFIEPVFLASVESTMNIQSSGAPDCTTYSICSPNCKVSNCDPWDLDRIDQVWQIDNLYHYVSIGTGVTMWFPDTGVQVDHVDFSGRDTSLAAPSAFNDPCYIDSNGNVTSGCTFGGVSGSANYDPIGHGTAVASIAAGNVNGVAKGANVDGIQVCYPGTDPPVVCDITWVAAGIDFAIAKSTGPAVMNISLEFLGGNSTMDAAVNRAIGAGITVVVAAGDESGNACDNSPGDVAGAITVGATQYNYSADVFDPTSNSGVCVDILAPGYLNWAADNGNFYANPSAGCGNIPTSTDGVCVFSQTSMAAPLVAGIAALYLQHYPTASPATVKSEVLGSAAQIAINDLPLGTPHLLASVWVPGNTVGAQPPGRGYPPFGGGAVTLPSSILIPIIIPTLF